MKADPGLYLNLILGLAMLGAGWYISTWWPSMKQSVTALKLFGLAEDENHVGPMDVSSLISEDDFQYTLADGTLQRCRVLRPQSARGGNAMVFYHGATPYAEDHTILDRLAKSMAVAGLTVYIPRLPRLQRLYIDGTSGEAMAGVYRQICDRDGWRDRQVSLIGFSFAGGLLLKALLEEEWGSVGHGEVMTFGTYCSLEASLRFILTGRASFGKTAIVMSPDHWGQVIFFHNFVDHIKRPFDKEVLNTALGYYVRGEDEAGEKAKLNLPTREREILDTILEPSSEAGHKMAEEIIHHARPSMKEYSPMTFSSKIDHRVWVLHGDEDKAVPYTEALALKKLLGRKARMHIVRNFGHKGAANGPTWLQQRFQELGLVIYFGRFLRAAERI